MKYLAIDVAIIPQEIILEKLVDINKNLKQKSSSYFELGKKDYLPHITLAMGVVKSEDVLKIKNIMKEISLKHHQIELIGEEFKSNLQANGEWNSSLSIKKNKDLVSIHKELMDLIGGFFQEHSSPEMFYSVPKVEEGSNALKWVKEYKQIAAYENYNPHISLSKGKISEDDLFKMKTPFEFTSSRLVISHLGVHCTCRKILFEVYLSK
ncbi:MAG: hypothetical protein WC758_06880 [Candidatus Woesearchaeota archaeon]|jgi:hypothetical protein